MALVLSNLTLGYDRHPAVHHLDLTIEDGALVAIVGPNGAGKTTLLKGIAGLLKPMGGSLSVPQDQRIAYLSQRVELDTAFPITVEDFVSMGLWREIGPLGRIGRERWQRVREALSRLGINALAKRSIGTLSGGELRRALFARLALQDADILLLDEPLTAVDAASEAVLLATLHEWHGAGKTILTVLHDLPAVRKHFPLTALFSRRLIAFGPTETVLSDDNLARARNAPIAFDDHAPVCDHDHHGSHHGQDAA